MTEAVDQKLAEWLDRTWAAEERQAMFDKIYKAKAYRNQLIAKYAPYFIDMVGWHNPELEKLCVDRAAALADAVIKEQNKND